MIPAQNIVAWGNVVPWADQRQVEQDLIISRALVEIFSDAMLRERDKGRDLYDLAHALEVFEGLCSATIKVRTRIASPEMLPGAPPLPHVICSPRTTAWGRGNGTGEHGYA